MTKPKFTYTVMVERVVKVPYSVEAKDERDALRQIKKSAKAGTCPNEVAKLGPVAEYGKLIRPGTWTVEKAELETAE